MDEYYRFLHNQFKFKRTILEDDLKRKAYNLQKHKTYPVDLSFLDMMQIQITNSIEYILSTASPTSSRDSFIATAYEHLAHTYLMRLDDPQLLTKLCVPKLDLDVCAVSPKKTAIMQDTTDKQFSALAAIDSYMMAADWATDSFMELNCRKHAQQLFFRIFNNQQKIIDSFVQNNPVGEEQVVRNYCNQFFNFCDLSQLLVKHMQNPGNHQEVYSSADASYKLLVVASKSWLLFEHLKHFEYTRTYISEELRKKEYSLLDLADTHSIIDVTKTKHLNRMLLVKGYKSSVSNSLYNRNIFSKDQLVRDVYSFVDFFTKYKNKFDLPERKINHFNRQAAYLLERLPTLP